MRTRSLSIAVITRIALIAALYAGLTVALAPISYGPLQVRVSEALTVLPIFFPEAVPGLFLGCLVANIFGGLGIYDIVFGSLLTLVAAYGTAKFRGHPVIALTSPVVVNGFGVPLYLSILFNMPYIVTALYVLAGEAAAVYLLGGLVYLALSRRVEIAAEAKHTL